MDRRAPRTTNPGNPRQSPAASCILLQPPQIERKFCTAQTLHAGARLLAPHIRHRHRLAVKQVPAVRDHTLGLLPRLSIS